MKHRWHFPINLDRRMLSAVRDKPSYPLYDRAEAIYHLTPGEHGVDDFLAQAVYELADGLEPRP